MMIVHTMAKNQDLMNSISNVLDVQTNPTKAFMLWFSSEPLAIPDPRWNAFKHEAIQLPGCLLRWWYQDSSLVLHISRLLHISKILHISKVLHSSNLLHSTKLLLSSKAATLGTSSWVHLTSSNNSFNQQYCGLEGPEVPPPSPG